MISLQQVKLLNPAERSGKASDEITAHPRTFGTKTAALKQEGIKNFVNDGNDAHNGCLGKLKLPSEEYTLRPRGQKLASASTRYDSET